MNDENQVKRDAMLERRAYIAQRVDERFLAYLEDRFGANLPCFQVRADGSFDALDAMRRDAYREVILWLRREHDLYLKHEHT